MEIDVPFRPSISIYELQGPDTRQTWIDSRIAREWVMPNRFDDFFWVALMKQPTRVGTLMVVTDKDRRQITAEISVGRVACPARAPRSHDRRHVRGRAPQWPDFPDHRRGPCAPGAGRSDDMQIIFANPAAEALLAEQAPPFEARPAASFISACEYRGREGGGTRHARRVRARAWRHQRTARRVTFRRSPM